MDLSNARAIELLMDNMKKGIMFVDGDHKIRVCNNIAKEITGIVFDIDTGHDEGQIAEGDIVILADGMGSGVKANILATLASKILGTMFLEGEPIEEAVETLASTLPICKVRGISYSTFSILQIFHNGDAY